LSDFAEIMLGDTNQGVFFRIPFWGHIVAASHDIFTKVGVCEDNGVPQRMQWSKYAFLENHRWRTAAKSNKSNSAADCPISFKFSAMTDMRVPRTTLIYGKHWGQKLHPQKTQP